MQHPPEKSLETGTEHDIFENESFFLFCKPISTLDGKTTTFTSQYVLSMSYRADGSTDSNTKSLVQLMKATVLAESSFIFSP